MGLSPESPVLLAVLLGTVETHPDLADARPPFPEGRESETPNVECVAPIAKCDTFGERFGSAAGGCGGRFWPGADGPFPTA